MEKTELNKDLHKYSSEALYNEIKSRCEVHYKAMDDGKDSATYEFVEHLNKNKESCVKFLMESATFVRHIEFICYMVALHYSLSAFNESSQIKVHPEDEKSAKRNMKELIKKVCGAHAMLTELLEEMGICQHSKCVKKHEEENKEVM